MIKNKMKLALAGLGLSLLATSASAATATNSFNVTATVIAGCNISSTANDLAFGNYDPSAAADKTGSTSFGMRCTKGVNYSISIEGAQAMTGGSGSEVLNYVLKNQADGSLWGDVASGNAVAGASTTSAESTYTIDGVISANQDVGVGAYSQVNTITITY